MKSTWKAVRMISILAGASAVLLSISFCCSQEASASALFAEETASVPEQQASQVNFERNYTDGMEQAVITGYDGSGAVLWTVQTSSYPGTQLPNCCDVGIENGKYYYVEGGTVITLDLRDGSRIWENPEFRGSTCCHVMDENGTLFICGYYQPDLFVVDKDGRTISRTERFREGYNWPHQIELHDGILTIWYEQNGESLQVRVSDVAGSAADAEAPPAEAETSSAEAETLSAGETVRLTPLSITATSELEPYNSSIPPYDLYTYYASYIDDGDLSTAWNEGVSGDGTGEYLELAYPAGTVLTGGVIWPGFYDTEELFYQNNAPTSLEISSGGVSAVVELGDSAAVWQAGFAGFSFEMDKEIVSDGIVRVTILGTRAGNTYDDTCISELDFTGREAEGQVSTAGGEIVAFGKNTADPEAALYWQVLAEDENSQLLISRDVLSAPPYDDENYYPVWSESDMRSWLNGEFYQNSFSEEEKAMIRDTAVTFATGMQEDGTWGQETVTDKVFLLNTDEAEMYFGSNEARKARPAEGAAGLEGIGEDGCASWWLDDIGFEQQGVAQVTAAGEIDTYGVGVNHLLGVRPVMWVLTGEAELLPETGNVQPQPEAGGAAGNDASADVPESIAESDMQRIFSEQVTEPVLYFLYDDYDYDGTYEAMIATEQPGGVYARIWFMDSSGTVTDLTGGREIYGYEFQDSANVRQRYLIDTGTQKFYVWENCAGGSGSLSYVFGVREGVPYEPAISGTVQSFQKEGEEYVYYGNDFSNGFHEYPRIVLTYDAESGEFW